MPLYSGDLKMVRVRRGERGHDKSRSLVFRISRRLPKSVSDDSGIKGSSPSEEESSSEEREENPPCSLKIKIPKSALFNGVKECESDLSDCNSLDSIGVRSADEEPSVLDDSMMSTDIFDDKTMSTYFQDANTMSSDIHADNMMSTFFQDANMMSAEIQNNDNPFIFDIQNDNMASSDSQDLNVVPDDIQANITISSDIQDMVPVDAKDDTICNDAQNNVPVSSNVQDYNVVPDDVKNNTICKDVQNCNTVSSDNQSYSAIQVHSKDVHNHNEFLADVEDDNTMPSDSHDMMPTGVQAHNLITTDSQDDSMMSSNMTDNSSSLFVARTHTISKTEESNPSNLCLRRSSRRLLLQMKKESQRDSPMHSPSVDYKNSAVSCHNYGQHPSRAVGQRRRRGKRAGSRFTDGRKRKYVRRGRPPKSAVSRSLNTVTTENVRYASAFKPPTNTVWTLVPKELFESEFFKSQVIKVRYTAPVKKNSSFLPPYGFSPSVVPQSVPCSNGKIHLKIPKVMVNTIPVVQQASVGDTGSKRPTVIYFKAEKNYGDYPSNQRTEINLPPQLNNCEFSKTQSDLLYLYDKYRMLQNAIVKKCYELTRGDVIETDCILSDLISRNPTIYSEKTTDALVPDSQYNEHMTDNSVLGLQPIIASPPPLEIYDVPDTLPPPDALDIISRNLLIESMLILYSEEAVLQ